MSKPLLRFWAGIALALPCCPQATKLDLSARDLYLESVEASPSSAQATTDKPGTLGKDRDLKRSRPQGESIQHLGVRYNVLLFGGRENSPQPVDPERPFKTGDCIALELQANRSGYLYVVAEGASGAWSPLVPSVLVLGEVNEIKFGERVRAPAQDCFEFTQPPGIERVFLFLSKDVADTKELVRLFQFSSLARDQHPAETVIASRGAVASLHERLGSRDLKLKKIDKPSTPGELPFTVYAVAPLPRVFVEVRLRHE